MHEYAPAPSALASLPELPAEFTGREEDLAFLLDVLDPGSGVGRPAVVVAGMGGVGKTTLAHAAGHASLERKWFTGVLLVDLRGYDPQPAQAEQALDSLLRLLGVPSKHIPPTGPEREVFYRSHLAECANEGERLLVVADNASSAAQVKPLLPPAPHGMIVTSRKALPGIGRPRSLHQLQPEDAVVLLDLALREADPGDQRVEEGKEAAERIAVACGCLPLALQIVAAQLIQDPGQPLTERAERLSSGERRLDSINDGERDLRTVFDQTLDSLLPQQQDLFRMLSLKAGPDISTAAAAALIHQTETVTDTQLSQLAATHLIERGPVRGRWQMHDLLRDYAHEKAQVHCQDNRTARRKYEQASQHLANYYVRITENADTHILTSSHLKPSPVFSGRKEALAWLDAERANIVATAHAQAPSKNTARLSFALRDYLEWRHRTQDVLAISALALDACRALDDKGNESGAWNNMGGALERLYRHDEALTAYHKALGLAEKTQNTHNQAAAWNGTGNSLHNLYRYDEALTAYRKALSLAEQIHDIHAQAITCNNIGRVLKNLHRYDEALAACQKALGFAEQTHDTDSQAAAWSNIGNVLESLHRYDEALTNCHKALSLAEQTHDTDSQAAAWNNIGSALENLHRYDEALTAYQKVLSLAEQTQNTRGQTVAWNSIGSALENLHRYDEALTEYQKALSLAEQIHDTAGQAIAWNSTGSALVNLHRYDEALTAYQKALSLSEQTQNTRGQAAAWNNISSALEKLDQYDEALTASQKVLSLAEQTHDTNGQAAGWSNIGNALESLHRYDEALTNYRKALSLAERTHNIDSQAAGWSNIGNALEKLHRHDEALTAYTNAHTFYEQVGNTNGQAVAWNNTGTALRSLHQYDEAVAAGQRAVEMLKSLRDFTHVGEALGELATTFDAAGAAPAVVRDIWLRSASAYQKAGAREKEEQSRAKAAVKDSKESS
ncbi:tetratricopeptide repeat protein [Streptomyces parvulus]|uniref:tetratricopeptide repeat protein n=1 Tax=Streptomyces parvulus TaxID=146923 RepID=UPI0037A901E9